MHLAARIALINLLVFVQALWIRVAVARAGLGLPRLLLAIPLVVANLYLPLLFDPTKEFTTLFFYLTLLTWVGNFKILAFILGRGSLSDDNLSIFQFLTLYSLPVTARSDGHGRSQKLKSNARTDQSAGPYSYLACKWMLKFVLFITTVYILSTSRHKMPVLLAELAQAFMLYWFLGVLMDGPAAFIGWMTGIQISPHFDAPYLSTSISSFWSRRWNLTVGNVLRFLCYDPVHEGRLLSSDKSYKPSRARTAAAICWTFFVSGLMHEFLITYLDQYVATGEWLLYFSLQGPLVIAESTIKKFAQRKGITLRGPLAIALTMMIQLIIAHCLFFPPIVRNKLDERLYANIKQSMDPVLRFGGLTMLIQLFVADYLFFPPLVSIELEERLHAESSKVWVKFSIAVAFCGCHVFCMLCMHNTSVTRFFRLCVPSSLYERLLRCIIELIRAS